jgi:hypothetical protein
MEATGRCQLVSLLNRDATGDHEAHKPFFSFLLLGLTSSLFFTIAEHECCFLEHLLHFPYLLSLSWHLGGA